MSALVAELNDYCKRTGLLLIVEQGRLKQVLRVACGQHGGPTLLEFALLTPASS